MATATQDMSTTRRDDSRLRRDLGKGAQGAKKDLSRLGAFWTKVSNDWVFNLSAMLAYNLLMSAFPILLVLLAIGGFLLGLTGAGGQSTMAARLSGALPNGSGRALLQNVTYNLNKSAGLLFVVGLVVAIFTGSRLFITIENAFGVVFRLRGRNVVRQNIMALGMMLLYTLLVPIILLASIVPSTIVRATPLGSNNPLAGFFVQAAGLLTSVLVAMILFGAIYVVVPNRSVQLREVWKGTLVAAVLLVLYEILFPIYLSLFLHPNNYGSTAAFAVVTLVFFYYLGVILLVGAEINSWASGQRQTAADIDAIMHEVQAHNTTRGAAGPTAGTATEDVEHQQGAGAVQTPEEAVGHERTKHKGDEQPPKYAESGVRASGYNVESKSSLQQAASETSPAAAEDGGHRITDNNAQAEREPVTSGAGAQRSGGQVSGTQPAHQQPGRASSGYAASPTMPASPSRNTQVESRPLTGQQRKAMGAVLAVGALALMPLVRWTAQWLRGDTRPTALD